jgi:FKBP-type peptidyl-prolyl cis-trans isomerase SlpA
MEAQFIGSSMTPSAPRVQPGSFLTLHYRLAGPAGDVINTFGGKPATLTLGTGELAPALEQALMGVEEGAHVTLQLPAGVYGERNPAMVQWIARQELRELGDPQEDYAIGDVVQFPTPDRKGQFGGVVVQLGEQAVLFDFNHPLAGQPVTFEVQLIGVL